MAIFEDYAYYYNAFYRNKDYKSEARQIDSLFQRYGKDIHKIINFGCGTGKHDLELVKLGGYQCTGIDMSPLMIDIARKNAEEEKAVISFLLADIQKFEPQEKYDAVISLFHVMSYQNTNQDIMSAFISARKALEKGGLFLFDVWYGPGVLSDLPCVRVKEVEDNERKLIRIATPVMNDKMNVVSVNYDVLVIDKETNEVQMLSEVHNMRYFFRPELELMLNETGFELVDNLDCNTLEETDFRSWTSYFIARAV